MKGEKRRGFDWEFGISTQTSLGVGVAALFCFPWLGWADFWWNDARVTDVKVGISAFTAGLKP